jgi:hypothetical protein
MPSAWGSQKVVLRRCTFSHIDIGIEAFLTFATEWTNHVAAYGLFNQFERTLGQRRYTCTIGELQR